MYTATRRLMFVLQSLLGEKHLEYDSSGES